MTAGAASSKLRIALMLETDGPGGAETMVLELARELTSRGHEVHPVGPAPRHGWLGQRMRDLGLEPKQFVLRGPIDYGCVRGLRELFRRYRIDVVHSHEFTMAVYGAAAALGAGVPHVITMHGGTWVLERWRRRFALRWALRRSAAAVAVSGATRATFARALGVPESLFDVVHNGIRMRTGDGAAGRASLALPPETRLALAVGNLYPVKGHAVLVRAAGLLAAHTGLPPWEIAIAGRGREGDDQHEALVALAAQLGVADRVRLLGLRTDVPDLLAGTDLFVMPSLSEGLPMAVLEAMGAGRAVVASAVGGIPEAISDGADGLLVPPNAPERLAESLAALLVDDARRLALGEAARQRVLHDFSVAGMTSRYEALYERGLRIGQ